MTDWAEGPHLKSILVHNYTDKLEWLDSLLPSCSSRPSPPSALRPLQILKVSTDNKKHVGTRSSWRDQTKQLFDQKIPLNMYCTAREGCRRCTTHVEHAIHNLSVSLSSLGSSQSNKSLKSPNEGEAILHYMRCNLSAFSQIHLMRIFKCAYQSPWHHPVWVSTKPKVNISDTNWSGSSTSAEILL